MPLIDEARAWPRAAAPFVSRGHGNGSVAIDIRVSPTSIDAVRNLVLGQFVPVGTAVVAFHTDARSNVAESVFGMQKREEGKWEFFAADAGGAPPPVGTPPSCTRCHAEAPTDFLFVSAEMAAKPPSNAGRDAGR